MTAPAVVKELVERFDSHRDVYRSDQYNEAQLREEFLNPFFNALGWDVYNKQGFAQPYKEVIHEAAIKVGGHTKAPDYCFRAGGGVPSFFVEAKKPSVDIREALSPAFQLRRYAWSAKLPVSILTDFEEWAVYDCRIRPVKTDRAATARVMYHTYAEYLDRWDELAGLFSPTAIRRGALDKFITSKKVKKGTAEVDDAFLNEIQNWRETLARNIALRNPKLPQRDLNFAVQRTIDRIVFLRICEDRGIEPYGRLQALRNGPNVYRRLAELFQRADERYNSGLFHFTPEKGRPEPPDEVTLSLAIDDRVLAAIIRDLYYPDSPYEFSVFPAEILGQVYEQFLGKVIRLTKGHRAVVEDKPEVKKAGGVYYTPAYIVEYIVEHTVGKLLHCDPPARSDPIHRVEPSSGSQRPHECGHYERGERKSEEETPKAESRPPRSDPGPSLTPKQAAKLRILDPACGSGSFLIGAYEYLLKWHRDWYEAHDPEKHARSRNPKLYRGRAGDWRLTTAERKRILLNNIYGVDIDPQAVEVTKLSLLLKVLEGESQETLTNQLRLFHERALPDLSNNIKCGNSLIGPDFYQSRQMSLLDEEEVYRINAFDWQAEFPHIFPSPSGRGARGEGGFDAVIGNPPYIRIQTMTEWAPVEVEFYKERYVAASKGNYDIYVVFIERGLSLLSNSGHLGLIVPHKFFNAKYGEELRDLLSKGQHLSHVVHFGHEQVFGGPTTYTCLLFLEKSGRDKCQVAKIHDLAEWQRGHGETAGEIAASTITSQEWNFVVGRSAKLFSKLHRLQVTLSDVADRIYQGLVTGADPVFILDARGDHVYFSQALDQECYLEPELMHALCKGAVNLRRYHVRNVDKAILFPYDLSSGKAHLLPAPQLAQKYPKAWEYLQANRQALEARERGKWKHDRWYAFGRTQNLNEMEQRKILTPSIASEASFFLDSTGSYYFVGSGGGGGGGYGITLKADAHLTYQYLLGLLNSRLVDHYLKNISTPFRGGYYAYNRQYIEKLPIRVVDLSVPSEQHQHGRMVELVDAVLDLHKRLQVAITAHERTLLQRQIEATDREIDRLVYELYGLSDEEIAIVEEATAS